MEILAIVSEYNPFHQGHLYQVQHLRERFGAEAFLIACMSGPFTQRGLPALCDKYRRAQLAVELGVNLVLELPLPYAIASADYFAQGALAVLSSTGLRYRLCFGSECGQLPLLSLLAKLRHHRPELYEQRLHEGLQEGLSFAKAEEEAARYFLQAATETLSLLDELELSPSELEAMTSLQETENEALWKGSNNQLGIAYLQAALALPKSKRPRFYTHLRKGQAYLDEDLDGQEAFASASAIRQTLRQMDVTPSNLLSHLGGHLPARTLAHLIDASQQQALYQPALLGQLLLHRLRGLTLEDLKQYSGFGDGLAERTINYVQEEAGRVVTTSSQSAFEDLGLALRSRRLPLSRVQRSLLQLLLGLTTEQASAFWSLRQVPYLRLLASDKRGRYLLKKIRQFSETPVVTKTSEAQRLESEQSQAFLALERRGTALYRQLQGFAFSEDFDKVPYLK